MHRQYAACAIRLGDLEGDEGQHLVAHRQQIEVGVEAADDAPLLQLVEPGLHRAPGHAEHAGQLHDPGPGGGAHGRDQAGVEDVDPAGHHEQDVYQIGVETERSVQLNDE